MINNELKVIPYSGLGSLLFVPKLKLAFRFYNKRNSGSDRINLKSLKSVRLRSKCVEEVHIFHMGDYVLDRSHNS